MGGDGHFGAPVAVGMKSFLVALSVALELATSPLSAQRLEVPMATWTPSLGGAAGTVSDSPVQGGWRDRRVEGTLVGAGLLGAAGYLVTHVACVNQPIAVGSGGNGRDCAGDSLLIGLFAGAVGAAAGYVVGRSISK